MDCMAIAATVLQTQIMTVESCIVIEAQNITQRMSHGLQ